MSTLARLHARLSPFLAPVGRLYALAMHARAELYARGAYPCLTPRVPTVSVGNVSLGGSGKTPLVGWLAEAALARGRRPVILTRGYKARPPHRPYLVTPGSPAEEAGDEPLLLARAHPGAAVVVDPLRLRAACFALETLSPDLFILDDGFQHLSLGRHVDLVLLTPEDLGRDWNRVFPAGRWREGRRALARATAFLVKSSPEEFAAARARIEERLGPLGRPVFRFDLRISGLRTMAGEPSAADDRPYLLATGVARPAGVAAAASTFFGRPPAEVRAFPDHHRFSPADVQALRRAADARAAPRIVITPKDAVKLDSLADERFLVLEPTPVFGEAMYACAPFDRWWADILQTS